MQETTACHRETLESLIFIAVLQLWHIIFPSREIPAIYHFAIANAF